MNKDIIPYIRWLHWHGLRPDQIAKKFEISEKEVRMAGLAKMPKNIMS